MQTKDMFVVLRWPAGDGYPRYSCATLTHANEIETAIERVQACATLAAAASIAARLNAAEEAA